jgi:hypothetical protein
MGIDPAVRRVQRPGLQDYSVPGVVLRAAAFSKSEMSLSGARSGRVEKG